MGLAPRNPRLISAPKRIFDKILCPAKTKHEGSLRGHQEVIKESFEGHDGPFKGHWGFIGGSLGVVWSLIYDHGVINGFIHEGCI